MNPSRTRHTAAEAGIPINQDWPVMFVSDQPSAYNPLQGNTVLVVGDEQPLTNRVREALRANGYRVQYATTSSEALDLLKSELPDLVVATLLLPDMDGYDLLSRIRGNPTARYLPVLFITDQDELAQQRRPKDSGIVDYLTTPLDEDKLIHSVRAVIKRHTEHELDFQRRVEEVRSQILGLVQHEFRTPLTFVMGYAEFLQDAIDQGLPHEEIKHSVDAIVEGSRRLHHLVESFLLLANLSRESLPNDEIYPLDPGALWRECVTEVRETLDDAGIVIKLAEGPDPAIVFGVMDLLREALSRLLDNAIRYRRPGLRTIWLGVVTKPGYVGWIIRDEGMGIPASLLAQLSSPFVRLHQRQPESHGIGLGLTLVRRVAELHKGYLEIESQEGVGSTFTLWVSDQEM